MVSIAIPTLQKSDSLKESLERYSNFSNVDEIIVICNGFCWDLNIPKVSMINLPKNIYVNPAWNLAVELSSSEYTILLNDDYDYTLDNHNRFLSILEKDDVGFVGLRFVTSDEINNVFKESRRCFGWGTCIGMSTKRYKSIPNYLKIYKGDDFIFYNSRGTNYALGVAPPKNVSVTSNRSEFEEIKNNDVRLYKKNHFFDKYRRDFKMLWKRLQY